MNVKVKNCFIKKAIFLFGGAAKILALDNSLNPGDHWQDYRLNLKINL